MLYGKNNLNKIKSNIQNICFLSSNYIKLSYLKCNLELNL